MIKEICQKTKLAANKFAGVDASVKNAALLRAKELILSHKAEIIAANLLDVQKAHENGRNEAFIDRLTLNDARIEQMAKGLDQIVALPDPVGEVVEHYVMPNGLDITRVRAALGVIGIIFEARPNVSIDASALCIKSGNGVVLRGSRESTESVGKLVGYVKQALQENGVSPDLVGLIESKDRQATIDMLKEDKYIDVVIPRGGEALKKVVLENATMPVIASSGGNCHMYIAPSAEFSTALELMLNAKTNRPSTCNALETLLVDRAIATDFLPAAVELLVKNGVEVRGTAEVKTYCPCVTEVTEEEFTKEYDDMKIKVKLISGLTEAIDHINRYSTNHSDAIITRNAEEAERFCKEVDSSAVYVNASTRFTDGFEFGLGAEMGISTQKLHVRGPIGLRELTSVKYVVKGNGQVRK